MTDERGDWDRRTEAVLLQVNRRAWVYFFLGITVYGGGSAAIMVLLREQPWLATLLVMFIFQLCILYFGTREIFRCISGGFRLTIEANRDTVPLFERIAKTAESLEENPDDHPLVKVFVKHLERATLDVQEEGRRIRGELSRVADALTKPVKSPLGKIEPPKEITGVATAGEKAAGPDNGSAR